MIASLRARLLAGLLALTAAGMLIAGGVTYAEQRSFAYQRVDDQTRDAPFAARRARSTAATATTARGRAGRGAERRRPARAARRHLRRAAHRARARRSVTLPVGSGITAKPDLPAQPADRAACSPSAATTAATACSPSATRGPAGS